jgi:hypothetical protein
MDELLHGHWSHPKRDVNIFSQNLGFGAHSSHIHQNAGKQFNLQKCSSVISEGDLVISAS